MLAKHPQLLRSAPERVSYKLRQMAFNLYLPQAQIISMVVRQPALLSRHSSTLQDCLQTLQALLNTDYQTAVMAAARAPQLLCWNAGSMAAKHQQLLEATQLPPAQLNTIVLQQPGLLTQSVTQLVATLDCMRQLLHLEPQDLGRLLLQDPQILLRGSRMLQEQVQELQEYLALPEEVVAQLLRRAPAVLAAGSFVWLTNITTLLEVLQLSPQQVQSAVLHKPQLLKMDPQRLMTCSSRLGQLLQQQREWRQQLQQLTRGDLWLLLRLDIKQLWRLAYLAEMQQQQQQQQVRRRQRSSISSSTNSLMQAAALAANRESFASKHPQFKQWLSARKSNWQKHMVLTTQAAAAAAGAAVGVAGATPCSAGEPLSPALQQLPHMEQQISAGVQQDTFVSQEQQQQQQQLPRQPQQYQANLIREQQQQQQQQQNWQQSWQQPPQPVQPSSPAVRADVVAALR
jgi:hypothetical protein